ncbi:MAG TPA: hypothetical protein HA341_02845 [Halobacteria archaeon]|nr:hypothetical protein [Halobacteria archaeon]
MKTKLIGFSIRSSIKLDCDLSTVLQNQIFCSVGLSYTGGAGALVLLGVKNRRFSFSEGGAGTDKVGSA